MTRTPKKDPIQEAGVSRHAAVPAEKNAHPAPHSPAETAAWLSPEVAKPHYWQRFLHLCRRHVRTILVCVALLCFLAILEDVWFGEIVRLDTLGYHFIVENRSDAVTPIMEEITSLASPVVLLVMLVIVAAFAPGRRPGLCATVNLVLVVLLNSVLKFIVHRPRPEGFRLISETGYSFPSGHSMVSMAFFGLLVWMIWRYDEDRTLRMLWSLFFVAVIALVGISRIYLGVHYTSDVLAGFCTSLIWLAFYPKVVAPVFLSEPVNPSAHRLKRIVEAPRHSK